MGKITLLSLVALACLQCCYAQKLRIAGGVFVNIEEVPYLASLVDLRNYYAIACGATIISNKWLVTAGHCVLGKTKSDLAVKTGASKSYGEGKIHDIKRIILHPNYKAHEWTISNDIALIELTKSIVFNNKQRSIPLATVDDVPIVGDLLKVSGFGKEHVNAADETMWVKSVDLEIEDLGKCQDDYYMDPVTNHMICAGIGGESSCHGDSGGPAIMNGRLAGIVSSGYYCNTTTVPAVFTCVNWYLEWIAKYVDFHVEY